MAGRPVKFARMSSRRVIVVGGGAAGFFAAITCAEAAPDAEVTVLERGPQFLSKVRISGGGRCNVTHACFDARELTARYPRGGRALLAPFKNFQASDTVAWFESRGVKLKTEADGRMFPVSDSSETIIDCLLNAAKAAGVKLRLNCGVERVAKRDQGGFEVALERRTPIRQAGRAVQPCRRFGNRRSIYRWDPARHSPATACCWPRADAARRRRGNWRCRSGTRWNRPCRRCSRFTSNRRGCARWPGFPSSRSRRPCRRRNCASAAPLLVTHWGLSGPVILRLSAWGARALHGFNYQFPLQINWLPHLHADAIAAELKSRQAAQPARLVVNVPVTPLPSRLWEQLVLAAGIARDTRWAALSRAAQHQLVQQLIRTEFPVTGKSLNKDEFVTCGGVRLGEVNFKTMESRICPGLHFAGELLDIDGITGGFNFQAAWTTGWIAGKAMAAKWGI